MPFELQPHLCGDLLELRPLRPDDFDALFAAAADPLIWEQHPDHDRWREDVFRGYFAGAMKSGGAFLVVDRKDGRAIGSSRYHGYDEAASQVEVGWTFLARSHWGGTCNAEMKRLMLEHAFRFVRTVIFRIGTNNLRSRRAVEKLGAVLSGTLTNDAGQEMVVYRLEAASRLTRERIDDASLADIRIHVGDLSRPVGGSK